MNMLSNRITELWPSLCEKAYAHMYGGYDEIDGGNPIEAMVDLTGKVTNKYFPEVIVICPEA